MNYAIYIEDWVTLFGYGDEARFGKGYGTRWLSLTGTIDSIFKVKRNPRAL